jgi:phytoene dehydrogenase-like protein
MKSDVVIIGAGIAGLATGALLAKQGKRVTVIEKGNQAGGRAYTYETKGFTLNYGPHAVYRPESGPLAELMGRLGRPVPKCGYVDASTSFWADGDRFGAITANPIQMLTTKILSMGGRIAFGRLMLAIKTAKPAELGEMTWGEWVDAHTGDESVRRLGRALGTVNTYARPAADLSAAFVVSHLQRNAFAKDYVGYMYGGWSKMYDAFADAIRAGGGTIIAGSAIDRVDVEAGAIVAAIASGTRYEADAFVCTLPPQDAPAIAAPGTALAAELMQWSELQDVRAYCIDLGFSRKVGDYGYVFDIERDLYFSVHSATATDLAPAGGQLLHAMAYLSPEEAANDARMDARRMELESGLDRWFAGWRDAAVVERRLPGIRVTAARSTPEQYIKNRVPLRATSASNLYFNGDARDLPHNLSELWINGAMEIADALVGAVPAARAGVPAA